MISTIKELIEKIQFEGNYRITLPDGSEVVRGDGPPEWTLHLRSQQVLREMMAHPSLGFGEGYMRGEVEIEGDIQKMLHFGFDAQNQHVRPSFSQAVKLFFGYLSRRNTLEGSRKNISAHYDLGNEFYSQWLDKDHKQYTCAYFENESDTIEQAQRQKLDLVCRKLQLKPGETVVEAGCGWGGFALYAAQQYGVRMRSYNISKEQVEFAREKARRHGVGEDRIEYILDDYRTIGQDNRTYDKFVSIGMLEHVGPENYKKLYDIIAKVVKPDGLALVHSIGREAPKKMDAWLEKYIFPGAVIPSLAQMVTPVEEKERPLFVQDVENLRYHYALTLDHWSARLQKHKKEIIAKYDEAFYRMFHLYLEASAAGFRYGGIQLYQILLMNGYNNSYPLTRRHFFTGTRSRAASASNGNGRNGNKSGGRVVKKQSARKSGASRGNAGKKAGSRKAASRK